jgi:hypothetical protein
MNLEVEFSFPDCNATDGSRVLLEKLLVLQLVKKFSAVNETRNFIAVFKIARPWSLS